MAMTDDIDQELAHSNGGTAAASAEVDPDAKAREPIVILKDMCAQLKIRDRMAEEETDLASQLKAVRDEMKLCDSNMRALLRESKQGKLF